MKTVLSKLLEAQPKLLQHPGSATNNALVNELRATVPAPVLAHFLRLVAQGRRGVAVVNNGVCSQCHIRLPSSVAAALVKSEDLHLCEQCGSFLVLPEPVAQPVLAPVVAPKARRVRKYSRQLAA